MSSNHPTPVSCPTKQANLNASKTSELHNNNANHTSQPPRVLITISKFLALVLRHEPSAANLTLDQNGWAPTSELIAFIQTKFAKDLTKFGITFDIVVLQTIVQNCPKQRYLLSPDLSQIRANQGHSLSQQVVNMQYTPVPHDQIPQLYHGTSSRFLDSIKSSGLCKMSRQYVHLSHDLETAQNVAKRHGGKIIIFHLDMKMLKEDGISLYKSENNVYLADHIAPWYLSDASGHRLIEKPVAATAVAKTEGIN